VKIHQIPLHKGVSRNEPTHIVIHAMGEFIQYNREYLHAVDFLREVGLSAHALICPDGSVIQCRPLDKGGYHAKGHNASSIGIEFLVSGPHNYQSFIDAIKEPYLTDAQYKTGVELCQEWGESLNVVRHSDIDPQRKKDPGNGFPWHEFINDIRG
jgi:N-acetyl-anhydromuramyl-L-alanine amidase AmpD